MSSPPVQLERRAGQRFPFLLPVFVRETCSGREARGFTQDISSRGVFFYTDAAFREGAALELTLNMPSEITLGDSMRVRCLGSVLRVALPPDLSETNSAPQDLSRPAETRIGVAVRLHGYEYLADIADSSSFQRVSPLPERRHETESPEPEQHQPAPSARNVMAR